MKGFSWSPEETGSARRRWNGTEGGGNSGSECKYGLKDVTLNRPERERPRKPKKLGKFNFLKLEID
jgi:hypothetical protein